MFNFFPFKKVYFSPCAVVRTIFLFYFKYFIQFTTINLFLFRFINHLIISLVINKRNSSTGNYRTMVPHTNTKQTGKKQKFTTLVVPRNRFYYSSVFFFFFFFYLYEHGTLIIWSLLGVRLGDRLYDRPFSASIRWDKEDQPEYLIPI